jgi:hypothetical protein
MAEILNDVMNRGARLQFGRAVPQQYRALAESCCLEEPQDRPTFDQIVGQLQGLLSQAESLQQETGALFGELVLSAVLHLLMAWLGCSNWLAYQA